MASRAEQEATGLFDSSDDVYKVNVIVLSVILTAAVLCGVVYELCRRRMNRGNLSTVNVCAFNSENIHWHDVFVIEITSFCCNTYL